MTWGGRPGFGVLAVLSSGLLTLASRDVGSFGPLALAAPVPLLIYALAAPGLWSVVFSAFAARLIGGLGMVWAYHAILPASMLALWILGQACGFSLVIALTRWVARGAPAWVVPFSFPCVATAGEFLFGLYSPHGSFGAVGYALVDVLPLLQIASVGGLAALSFVVTLSAMTCASWVALKAARRTLLLAGAGPLVAVTVFGLWRLNQEYESHARVGLVAIDSLIDRARRGNVESEMVARHYADAVRALPGERATWVVLPEKMFTASAAPLQSLAAELGLSIVAGFDETLPGGRRANSARVFMAEGFDHRYLKRRLIPGLEADYTQGDGLLIVDGHGVAICKDLDFPGTIRDYGRAGVRLLLVPAWDFVADGRMHARMAVVRGVENGFSLARAASAGRLTLSDRFGRIVAEDTTSGRHPVTLVAELGLRGGGTTYARIGDAFGWICVAGAALLLTHRAARWRRERPAGEGLRR